MRCSLNVSGGRYRSRKTAEGRQFGHRLPMSPYLFWNFSFYFMFQSIWCLEMRWVFRCEQNILRSNAKHIHWITLNPSLLREEHKFLTKTVNPSEKHLRMTQIPQLKKKENESETVCSVQGLSQIGLTLWNVWNRFIVEEIRTFRFTFFIGTQAAWRSKDEGRIAACVVFRL